jgi:hypothetical protein
MENGEQWKVPELSLPISLYYLIEVNAVYKKELKELLFKEIHPEVDL